MCLLLINYFLYISLFNFHISLSSIFNKKIREHYLCGIIIIKNGLGDFHVRELKVKREQGQ